MPFAQERIGFKHPPKLFLRQDTQNANNPLGKTAYYDPQAKSVTLYITRRHPKDVMRSLSHELVHHKQNCDGNFDNVSEMGEGYAQKNSHLREMERQAYEMGNMCFRDWEDSIKNTTYFEHLQKGDNITMSTKDWKNGEVTKLLSEAWGFGFDLDNLNEATPRVGYGGDDEAVKPPDKEEKEIKELEEEVEEIEEDKKGGKDWHATGKSKGQRGAHDEDTDYSGHGMRTGDESDTDPGDKDDTWRKGEQSKTHPGRLNKENLNEDSGEDEAWHQWKNEHADDDHIKEIEHHLRALKDDRDYERHEAEYDHDKYEDEGYDKMEEQVRRVVRKTIRKMYESKKKK